MTVIKKSRWVKYSSEQMFNLVNDVEQYEKFLPYCAKSMVIRRFEHGVEATLVISAAGMSKSFTTLNRTKPYQLIELELVDGPFSSFQGFWHFEPVNQGCQISFNLEFEIIGRILSSVVGPIFEQVGNKMVDSFCERAQFLYD